MSDKNIFAFAIVCLLGFSFFLHYLIQTHIHNHPGHFFDRSGVTIELPKPTGLDALDYKRDLWPQDVKRGNSGDMGYGFQYGWLTIERPA